MLHTLFTEKPTEQSPLSCIFEDARVLFPNLTKIQTQSDKLKFKHAVGKIGNWESLCENLKVDSGIIDRLRFSNDQPETKKSNCLNAYYDKGEAAWEEIVLAVAQDPVNKAELARNIARKYLREPNRTEILEMLQSCN